MATRAPKSSSLRLRPATSSDLPDLVLTTLSAFATNQISLLVFPRTSTQSSTFWHDSLSEELHDPNARFLVVEDMADPQTPKFAAFAKWNVQPADTAPAPLPGPEVWPSDGDVPLAVDYFGKLFAQHEKIMGSRPHWYLELIATQPDYQGRGAGGLLMQWGVDRADADGWECYLDATPDGLRLYERFGFEEVEKLPFLDGTYEQVFMIRPARSKP